MSKLSENIDRVRNASREKLDASRERLAGAKDVAVDLASESSVVAREKMSESKARAAELLGQGKDIATERAAAASAATRQVATKAAEKSTQTVDKNPFMVVAGGLAMGLIAAVLLPRTKVEAKYVGAAGRKINDTAKKAVEAAKEAGHEQIASLGLNSDSMRDQFKDLIGKLFETAKSAALAAQDVVKDDVKSDKDK